MERSPNKTAVAWGSLSPLVPPVRLLTTTCVFYPMGLVIWRTRLNVQCPSHPHGGLPIQSNQISLQCIPFHFGCRPTQKAESCFLNVFLIFKVYKLVLIKSLSQHNNHYHQSSFFILSHIYTRTLGAFEGHRERD